MNHTKLIRENGNMRSFEFDPHGLEPCDCKQCKTVREEVPVLLRLAQRVDIVHPYLDLSILAFFIRAEIHSPKKMQFDLNAFLIAHRNLLEDFFAKRAEYKRVYGAAPLDLFQEIARNGSPNSSETPKRATTEEDLLKEIRHLELDLFPPSHAQSRGDINMTSKEYSGFPTLLEHRIHRVVGLALAQFPHDPLGSYIEMRKHTDAGDEAASE